MANYREINVLFEVSPRPAFSGDSVLVAVDLREISLTMVVYEIDGERHEFSGESRLERVSGFEFEIPRPTLASEERCNRHVAEVLRETLCPGCSDAFSPRIAAEAFIRSRLMENQAFDLRAELEIVERRFVNIDDYVDDDYDDELQSTEVIQRLRQERRMDGQDFVMTHPCGICLEELSGGGTLIELPCTHIFHESCIVQWLEIRISCPYCRQRPFGTDNL